MAQQCQLWQMCLASCLASCFLACSQAAARWSRSRQSHIIWSENQRSRKEHTDRLHIKPTNLYNYHAIDELLKYIVVQLDIASKFYTHTALFHQIAAKHRKQTNSKTQQKSEQTK